MLYLHKQESYFNTKSNRMNLSVKLFVQQFNKQEVNIKLLTIFKHNIARYFDNFTPPTKPVKN